MSSEQLKLRAARWIESFASALLRRDSGALAAHFTTDGNWRDVIGFGWDIDVAVGRAEIAKGFETKLAMVTPRSFKLSSRGVPPRWVQRAGVDTIEVFVEFETSTGTGAGVVRLVAEQAEPPIDKAWILLTALSGIHGHPEAFGKGVGGDEVFARDFGGENWLDKRTRRFLCIDREPQVLVVGAGQAGLSIAARLGALSIDTLIIERNDEVGDNWRNRYHSLALHNEVYGNHLPYMPFPPSFPTFVPKDKLADWFKAYTDSMDINVWTGTSLVGGAYDAQKGRWVVEVANRDGSRRRLHPSHLVFATGVSAIPIYPQLEGLDDFAGTVVHSGSYTSGGRWAGREVAVLGTGNSGHDVAQDLHACGARVTMVQRNPTTVLSLKEAQKLYALYTEGLELEDADLLAMALPHPVLVKSYQMLTKAIREADKGLLEGLEERGFRLDFGKDDTGFQMKYLQRGGGYYFNVGCSDLIINGDIDLIQFSEIDRFISEGIRMRDGTVRQLDLLVAATGFKNQQDVVREYLGDEIADRIGPVWGFGQERELRNMWKQTPQRGLWFNAGSLAQCRIYSKYLALQILAEEYGLKGQPQTGHLSAQPQKTDVVAA